MADLSVLSDATLQQLAEGKTPDPSKLSDKELEFLAANPPNSEGPSKLESFSRGALNNFPLAKQAVAGLEEGDYSKNLGDLTEKAASAKAANPKTYGAGAVTGAMAPLAIPVVGEAMEAAPIATNAALGAANAVSDTDLSQNPAETVKEAGKGALIGTVSSALLGKAGNALKEPLNDLADTQAVKTFKLRPGMLGHMSEDEVGDLGNFTREAGLVDGTTRERLNKAMDLKQQVGAQIGDSGMGSMKAGFLKDYTAPLEEKAQELSKLYAPEAKSEVGWYINGVKDIQQNGNDFDGLQKLKEYYGDKAFNDDHQVVNKAAADVYTQIKSAMNDMIMGSPEEYQSQMTAYKHLSDLSTGLRKQLGAETAGSTGGSGGMIGSQIKKLPGPIRAPLGAAAIATGHPIYGVMAALPEVTDPAKHVAAIEAINKNIPTATGGVSYVVTKIMTALHKNPQSLGKFAKPLAQAAQTGGNDGIAATHFILSQQHPEYNNIINGDDSSNDNSR